MINRNKLIESLNIDFQNYNIVFIPFEDGTNMIGITTNNIYIINPSFSDEFYRTLTTILKDYGVLNISYNNIRNIFWSSQIVND
jgi:hypothetical protein